MNNPNFDDRLIRLLEKETEKEKWRKKLIIKGVVTKKKITKKGSFMFTVRTSKSEYDVVVPKHRKKEFELAEKISGGDSIKATGDKSIGVVFCDRLERLCKPAKYDEKQSKLEVE